MDQLIKPLCCFSLILLAALSVASVSQAELVADFDDLSLAPESHFDGPDPNGTEVPGPFGSTVVEGSFSSSGVEFVNRYNQTFDSWSSFAYSNETDTTTPGFGNQYSAYVPDGGAGMGEDNFGVAFGVDNALNPTDVAQLQALPSLYLPQGYQIASAMIANVTYPALSMLNGDAFAKQFGGPTGDDPDFFKLSVYGIDADGLALGTEVEFYLADYRFEDNSLDYIVDDWTELDLSALSGARSLHFNLSSSDVGEFGMNTPAYFAIDNLTAVPEAGSLSLVALAGLLGGGLARRRRKAVNLDENCTGATCRR